MLALEVELFLTARKSLPGKAVWRRGSRENQFRIVWPIEVDGEIAHDGPRLEIVYSASAPHLRLSVSLNIPPVIFRADVDETTRHTNHPPLPAGVPREVFGHNCHLWADNRPRKQTASVPAALPIARPLDKIHAGWPAAVTWVCVHGNIDFDERSLPGLPRKENLL